MDAIAITQRDGYPVLFVPTTLDGAPWWMAKHPDLPGCMSDGPTKDVAIDNLDDARALYLLDLQEDGIDPPAPMSGIARSVGTTGGPMPRLIESPRIAIDAIAGETTVALEAPVLAIPA